MTPAGAHRIPAGPAPGEGRATAPGAPARPDRAASAAAPVPLVVDLDGTLCRTDTLHEAAFGLAARRPWTLAAFPGWLARGRAGFKRAVADRAVLDPALLPYDEAVLALARAARDEGRPVVLVSAADHRQVEAVAAHLGLFDEVTGTGSAGAEGNLSREGKARHLVARHGAGGFDYVGDATADLPVWAAARRALAVRPSPALRRAAHARGLRLETVGEGARAGGGLRAAIRACRPHQWAKNALIAVPILTALEPAALPAALLAILCFSLTASAIYVVNDLVDLPADRLHPRKRARPFAAGALGMAPGLALSAGLLALAAALAAALLPWAFAAVLAAYLALTLAYSFWIKRKMVADVIALAGLYTLRIVAGGAATGIALSPWLLAFSMFLFFSLATIKRQAELEDLRARGGDGVAGRNLVVADLPILQAMSIGAAQSAVLVFALYAQDPAVQAQFRAPGALLAACPVLFFWLARMQLLTRRGHMTDDPLVFTFRDRVSLACGALVLASFALAVRGLPW